jgi:hypothetical protein
LQPSVGHAPFTAKGGTVPRDPDGDARRRDLIATAAVPTIGALARVEYDVCQVEPPGGKTEPFERFRRLFDR